MNFNARNIIATDKTFLNAFIENDFHNRLNGKFSQLVYNSVNVSDCPVSPSSSVQPIRFLLSFFNFHAAYGIVYQFLIFFNTQLHCHPHSYMLI